MAGSTWTWIGATSDPTLSTNWSPSGHPQPGDTIIISGSTTVPPDYVDASLSGITFDLIGNVTLAFSNATTVATTSQIDALSVIDATGTATTLSLAGPFTNLGTIEVTGTQANLTIPVTAGSAAPGWLGNQGTILVGQGDTLAVNGGTIADSGTILVSSDATLVTGGTAALVDIDSRSSTATAIVSGGTWLSNGTLVVGDTGGGSLTIDNGGVLNAGTIAVVIGSQTSSVGTISLATGGTLLAASLILDNDTTITGPDYYPQIVGSGANGFLTISGGTVAVGTLTENAYSTILVNSGALSVSGAADIGEAGTGAILDIAGGLSSAYGTTLGDNSGSGGTAVVAGGTLLSGWLTVGNYGTGSLTIGNGGLVNTGTASAVVASTGDSTGTLSLESGGTLTATGVTIGDDGNAVATVNTGATLVSTGGIIVNQSTPVGPVRITGPNEVIYGLGSGTLAVNGGFVSDSGGVGIGGGGTASLVVEAGGTFAANLGASYFSIGGSSTIANEASVTVNDGLLTMSGGPLAIGNGGNALLLVENGGTVITTVSALSAAAVSTTGSAQAGVTLTGTNSVWDINGSGGQLDVGASVSPSLEGTGSLTVSAGALLNAGTNTVAIGNASAGSGFASGTVAVLGGTLLGGEVAVGSTLATSNGTLTIGSGGLVSAGVANDDGLMAITGGTLQAASLTANANGAIDVSSGSLSVSGDAMIGSGAALTATGGAVTTGGTIVVASSGSGALLVQAGASVAAAELDLAMQSLSSMGSVAVDGAASSLSVTGALLVASSGTASVDVSDGGSVVAAGGMAVGGASSVSGGLPGNGTGVVSVDAGGTLTASSIMLGYGQFELASGSGTLVVSGAGALVNDPGGATVGDGGFGTLEISNGGVFTTGSNAGITIGQVATAEGHVIYGGGLVTVTDGTLNTGGVEVGQLTFLPDVGELFTAGTLMIGQGGVVNVGAIGIANAVTMAGGTLDSTAAIMGTVVTEIAYGSIDGYGTVIAPSLDISVYASSGTLEFTGPTLLGTSAIEGGAAFQIDHANGSAATVVFATSAGRSTLILGAPQAVDRLAIDNWQNGDVLAFNNGVTVTGARWLGGTLDVFTSGGTYDFTNVGLAAGTTPIFTTGANSVELVSCFAAGTRIATTNGPRRVEELAVGDTVRTGLGGKPRPIVWIGHRTVDCTRHPNPRQVWPVRIAAGAFGRRQPGRDLYVSPDHAVYADGVLIPVKYLVNGETIAQVPCDRVAYYHLELPRHDVVLAEGLPAESYLDTGDRGNFVNSGRPIALYPDFSSRVWEAEGYAELIVTGPKLDVVRARLARTVRRKRGARKRAAKACAA